ncbi:MAG: glutathione S-transferase family protein [Rhodospirillaceae bacterium]|nr:glutathione S-transferase family protein [Rhodospirillaceae bacterium]
MIVLRAKKVEFDVTYITKEDKPDWFLELSPHGKVPVLKVNDIALFESNAIAEFLDEVVEPRLAPQDPIMRAYNRAWTDFTGNWAKALNQVTYAKTVEEHASALNELPLTLQKLEDALSRRSNNGPYFNDENISLVDAAYAPFIMRFEIVEGINPTNILKQYPNISAWSDALMENEFVINSVPNDFSEVYQVNLYNRKTLAAGILNQKQ